MDRYQYIDFGAQILEPLFAVPETDESGAVTLHRQVRGGLPGRHPDLQPQRGGARGAPARCATEAARGEALLQAQ